ncbi:MAG: class 1 isoprenoid biosynthesis enzyme [Actinobacteria bacterium]|nr:class 1 isoprenoid biosynthesis enzyme [Actinomycetota bacterium]
MQTEKYIEEFTTLWLECSTQIPLLGVTYSYKGKLSSETQLEEFLQRIKKGQGNRTKPKVNNTSYTKVIFPAIRTLLKSAFNFEDNHLDIVLSDSYIEATKKFIKKGHRFDPKICMEDIFQACRNVWIMNGIQSMMGLSVDLTPSVFAYSMLYPYTDNYLDNSHTTSESKIIFSRRFQQRIEGEKVVPGNRDEKIIFDLIGMIEDQYERSCYPKVFESLLAIHHGQTKSISLLDTSSPLSEKDVLEICIEKGGASVLANGYLVSGSLTESQERFLFGFGAYLQLVDDIQDVSEDSRAGLLTPFSQALSQTALDKFVNRTFNFGIRVMDHINCFKGSNLDSLKNLMEKSIIILLIESVGLNDEFYSRSYAQKIEEYSPFRFSYLKKRRNSLSSNRVLFMKEIEEFILTGD